MQRREAQLAVKEKKLQESKENLAQLISEWSTNEDQQKRAVVSLGSLKRWHQHAKAIGRSEAHLKTVDRVIVWAEQDIERSGRPFPACEIELKLYKVMLRDRKKFDELALHVIEQWKREKNATDDDFLFGLFKREDDSNGSDQA